MRAIGIDLGTKSMGIAISDNSKKIVNPLKNYLFSAYEPAKYIETLNKLFLEYHNEIDLIVLGFPLKLNNKSSPWSDTVVEFGKLLKVTFKNIHVKLQDERFSTKQATGYLKQLGFKHSKVKNIKDKLSAQIILQNYLELNV